MPNPNSLITLLAGAESSAIAIEAPGRQALTFAGLAAQLERTIAALNALGIGRKDRVAIVLPNGPEMGVAFLAVAAGATACPLNPAYRAEEFEFYLGDLAARALIVARGSDSPAVDVARRLGVPILELKSGEGGAGCFQLTGAAAGPALTDGGGGGEAQDIALILHTSGTTSRPKMVPLSHANLCASARHIGTTLALGPGDRGLNIMPLFHIHGLIACLLAPLAAGSPVVLSPGFDVLRFFGWMREFRPTWMSAVPTMHQAILTRAAKHQDVIREVPLRFLRSSSSSMPPQVIAELEAVFATPLIESYGMTEATHQMASNPLPPGRRVPGSVGPAAGPDIAIMNEAGELLAPGMTGEVVIRGPNVTAGYLNNPSANADAFSGGWFRTGDQGVLDADGYLRLTGRLKEIINRGGEKVSPREVDEVLMDHPAIAQVVTFGMPHPKLGEDVAAAVVLRDGATVSEAEIRAFARERLADFKVPRRVLVLDEIPKGATGKLQRIGLAEKLGLSG